MWKSICSALGAYTNTKTSILTSCYPPLDSNPQLYHPIVFNWALLTSCPPMRSDYWSPLSIGAMWKDALFAAQTLSAKVVFGQATQVAYFNISRIISIEIKDLYMGEGRAECVVYNLAHTTFDFSKIMHFFWVPILNSICILVFSHVFLSCFSLLLPSTFLVFVWSLFKVCFLILICFLMFFEIIYF